VQSCSFQIKLFPAMPCANPRYTSTLIKLTSISIANY